MCLKPECKFIECVELDTGYKIAVHYRINSKGKYKILWIDYWCV